MPRMVGIYSVPNAPSEKSCSYVRWSCCVVHGDSSEHIQSDSWSR